jgi:hypothetical protein
MTSNNIERPCRPLGNVQQRQTKQEENLRALGEMTTANSTGKKLWSWSDQHPSRREHRQARPLRAEGKTNAHQSGVPGAGPPGGPAPGTPAQQYNSSYTTQRHRLTQKTWETHGLGSKPSMGKHREHKEKQVEIPNRAVVTPPPLYRTQKTVDASTKNIAF